MNTIDYAAQPLDQAQVYLHGLFHQEFSRRGYGPGRRQAEVAPNRSQSTAAPPGAGDLQFVDEKHPRNRTGQFRLKTAGGGHDEPLLQNVGEQTGPQEPLPAPKRAASGQAPIGEGGQRVMFAREFSRRGFVLRYAIEWHHAPKGGAVSGVNGKFYEGGEFMPVHGKSDQEPGNKAKKKPGRVEKTRDRMGDLVEVPEGHKSIENIVAGHPLKVGLLNETALAYLGITKKQAQHLKEIWEMDGGSPYVPREVLPPSYSTKGHAPTDDWDIMAKWKAHKEQKGQARRDEDAKRMEEIKAEEAKAAAPPPPKPERPRDFSDQELAERDYERNYSEVMDNPDKASSTNIRRAFGYLDRLQRHNQRRADRGELTQEQATDFNRSLDVEKDHMGGLLKQREAGEIDDPEHRTRAKEIARRAVEDGKNIHATMKEMGLTPQEKRLIMDEVLSEHEKMKQGKKKPPSEARKRAQDKQTANQPKSQKELFRRRRLVEQFAREFARRQRYALNEEQGREEGMGDAAEPEKADDSFDFGGDKPAEPKAPKPVKAPAPTKPPQEAKAPPEPTRQPEPARGPRADPNPQAAAKAPQSQQPSPARQRAMEAQRTRQASEEAPQAAKPAPQPPAAPAKPATVSESWDPIRGRMRSTEARTRPAPAPKPAQTPPPVQQQPQAQPAAGERKAEDPGEFKRSQTDFSGLRRPQGLNTAQNPPPIVHPADPPPTPRRQRTDEEWEQRRRQNEQSQEQDAPPRRQRTDEEWEQRRRQNEQSQEQDAPPPVQTPPQAGRTPPQAGRTSDAERRMGSGPGGAPAPGEPPNPPPSWKAATGPQTGQQAPGELLDPDEAPQTPTGPQAAPGEPQRLPPEEDDPGGDEWTVLPEDGQGEKSGIEPPEGWDDETIRRGVAEGWISPSRQPGGSAEAQAFSQPSEEGEPPQGENPYEPSKAASDPSLDEPIDLDEAQAAEEHETPQSAQTSLQRLSGKLQDLLDSYQGQEGGGQPQDGKWMHILGRVDSHLKQVNQALASGRDPYAVLGALVPRPGPKPESRHPELIGQRNLHDLTRFELEHAIRRSGRPYTRQELAAIATEHEKHIKDAIDRGLPLRYQVLRDYPNLKAYAKQKGARVEPDPADAQQPQGRPERGEPIFDRPGGAGQWGPGETPFPARQPVQTGRPGQGQKPFKLGKGVFGQAVREAAAQHQVDPNELGELAHDLWWAKRLAHREQAQAMASIRSAGQASSFQPAKLAAWENAGRDHSTYPGWDEFTQEIVSTHPELGLQTSADPAGELWDLMRQTRQPEPERHDPDLIRHAAERLLHMNQRQRQRQAGPREQEPVPFARGRHQQVQRYARMFQREELARRFQREFSERN